jgi:hypothetical protein
MYTPFFYLRFTFLFSLPFLVFAETSYEPNNTLDDATPLYVNGAIQEHKFDYTGDEDWLVFYAEKGTPYNIEIESDSIAQDVNPEPSPIRNESENQPLFQHKMGLT